MTLETPQGGIPDVGHTGFKIPADRVDESRNRPGSQPNTILEPSIVPNSGGQPLVWEGEPSVSRTSVVPEAPDCLLEALRGASMDEENRTLMSAVIQKVSSAKSGLTEACTSLLTGFEVSDAREKIPLQAVAPETLSGVRKEKHDRGSIYFRRKLTKDVLYE